MPESLTAENGAKFALIGEFHEYFTHECPDCQGCGLGPASPHAQGETKCAMCNGAGEITERILVEWSTIKEIYKRAVAVLGQSQTSVIAEAVAAERERCAKICEDYSHAEQQSQRTGPLADPYNISSGAKAFAAANLAGFIRSPAFIGSNEK